MSARPRILGWDFLRGLCALAVMAYHLMYWQGLADLSTLGTYGVYLFFVLSGASLAYAYPRDTLSGWRGIAAFLLARWMRLAPLYLALCLVYLVMLRGHLGQWASDIPHRLLLNGSFAFGFADPALSALLIGGWSLGIEFVFYLLMPAASRLMERSWARWAVLVILVLIQAAWVMATVGRDGLAQASVAYHQVPAFAAYFYAGCLIGRARLSAPPERPWGQGVLTWCLLAALLLAAVPQVSGDELTGWRGLLLPPACGLAVWSSGAVQVPLAWRRLAAWLGDITYGTYLLHPMLFFALAWFVIPGLLPDQGPDFPVWIRWGFVLGIGAGACALAVASERWIERPFRQAGRRLVTRAA